MDTEKVGYTGTMQDAFARLVTVSAPTIDDLKLMMVLEASGKSAYAAMARGTSNFEVRQIFERNGREELGHAMRVRQVIKLVHGETPAVPSDDDNPFAVGLDAVHPVSKDALESIAAGEMGGGELYDRWAMSFSDEKAAQLLRQNGIEERQHGDRIRHAASLL